jgi:DNA-binding transcriptional regulator YhcF (GntR family)
MTDQDNAVIPAQFTPSLTRIQAMTGQSAATVKRALNVLEAAGWVVRKRPDVAKARADKERTRYALKIPKARLTQSLARPTESLGLASERAKAGLTQSPGLGSHRATSHTAFHTDQNQQASASSPEDRVRESTGATADEAAAIVKRIREERNPRSLDGFVRHLAASGDLGQYLTDVRAAAARSAADIERTARQRQPRCPDGITAGTQVDPTTGRARCGACHARNQADRLNGTARVINLHTKEVS